MIRRGDAEVMLAGGSEAGIHEALVAGFCAMRALSTRNDDPAGASRPFDAARDGFVIGEGCGMIVLEELEHALARGAEPLAELIGYGATADASHITLPAPGGSGAVRAARRALDKAGLGAEAIDHLNAHATSTPEGDKAELMAIRTIFGDRAPEVAITANKSMVGHTLGAAGAIEAIVDDPVDPDRDHPADDQPDLPRRARPGPRPDAARRQPARGPDCPQQLVRVRRPEQRPDLQPVRRMTDEHAPDLPAADAVAPVALPAAPDGTLSVVPDLGEADRSLLDLVDRLAVLLERSELTELEVEAGETGLILRKAAAIRPAPAEPGQGGVAVPVGPGPGAGGPAAPTEAARPSVKAPLTGIFYASPAPGSANYVQVGGEVAVGQVIGLIEAMKLFNEIKSDLAGRVVRVVAESGQLVKARQPLIEVEPL